MDIFPNWATACLYYTCTHSTGVGVYSDESAQEPFRCGMGNLFMCYQELIQYPMPCYTEQISNASGVEISVSDTLSLSFRREREKKIVPILTVHRRVLWCVAGRNMCHYEVKSNSQQNQQQALKSCLWGLGG